MSTAPLGSVRAANSALAELGFTIEGIVWETPLRVTLRRGRRTQRGGFAIMPGSKPVVVEEPYPDFFPSEVFLQRVMVLA